jgi:hypothetical protein
MTTAQSKRAVTKDREQTTVQSADTTGIATNPLDEVDTGISPAYRSYLEAQKGLAKAFRGRGLLYQEAYNDAERRYKLCEEAMEKAVKEREKADRDAMDMYRETVDKAIEKASGVYREKLKQALMECKQKIDDAWIAARETSAEMTAIFEGGNKIVKKDVPSHDKILYPEPKMVSFRERLLTLKKGCVSMYRRAIKSTRIKAENP